jgi:hypothetical protein
MHDAGKILQVKVDEEVAGNVENVEKLFVAASQNARQKVHNTFTTFNPHVCERESEDDTNTHTHTRAQIADRINSMLAASHQ